MAHLIPAHIDAHIAAKPKNANSRVWPWLTLASTALMSACATAPSYQLRLYRGATPPVPGPQAAPGRPAMTRPTRTQSVRRAQAAFI